MNMTMENSNHLKMHPPMLGFVGLGKWNLRFGSLKTGRIPGKLDPPSWKNVH